MKPNTCLLGWIIDPEYFAGRPDPADVTGAETDVRIAFSFRTAQQRSASQRGECCRLSGVAAVASITSFASSAADTLSAAEIAHAAYTADDLDIAYAKIALKKSKTPAIRDLAERMIKDHSAANDSALALVKKLGVTPRGMHSARP